MLPAGFEPVLAAPGELVKADCRDWAEQPDPGDDREEEGHQRTVRGHHRRGNTQDGVDEAGEHQVAAHVLEIAEPLAERPAEIVVRDLADGDFSMLARSGSNKRFGGHHTSPRKASMRLRRAKRQCGPLFSRKVHWRSEPDAGEGDRLIAVILRLREFRACSDQNRGARRKVRVRSDNRELSHWYTSAAARSYR